MSIGAKVRSHVHGILLASMLATAEAAPIAEEVHQFDVATPDAATAIQQFGEQSGIQILADGDGLRGKQLNTVTGEHSVDEALRLLLAGTGYTYQYVGERGVALVLAAAEPQPSEPAVVDVPTGEEQSGPATPPQMGGFEQEEVIVVGSRLTRAFNEEGITPVKIFYESDIKKLGASSVADVLNYVPEQSAPIVEQATFAGTRTVRLRGLNVGTTLVLINGRRTISSALLFQSSGAFDLNTIPLSAVERIEVLSDGASAVYGADAVGGVLNIVLKSPTAPTVDLFYGTAEQGADEQRASLGAGYNGERFRASFMLDAFNRDYLFGIDRERSASSDFRRFGSTDMRLRFGNPANVGNCASRTNLPGLNAPCATVPVGSAGRTLTPADFVATAGQQNLTSNGQYSSAVPKSERFSGVSLLEFAVTPNFGLFGEFLYTERENVSRTTPPLFLGTVPANNLFNPFDVPVPVSYMFTGIGAQESMVETDSLRAVLGAKGRFADSWSWELTTARLDDEGSELPIEALLNTAKVNAALASQDPNTALNLFQDGPGNLALLNTLRTPGKNMSASEGMHYAGLLRGEVFNLPGGPVEAVVGAEMRDEELTTSSTINVNNAVAADRRVSAGFAELRVPLIGEPQKIPAVQGLSLTLAGRYDDYDNRSSDFSQFSPQYGLLWTPLDRLLLRASYGSSFRAPSLYELNQPRVPQPAAVADPARGNVLTQFTLTTGGNPALVPEDADSMSAGFVLTLGDADSRLKLGATYWALDMERRIFPQLNPNIILANEIAFSSRVVRNPTTGALVSIDSTAINLGQLETSGVDLQISNSFATPVGRFSPSLLVTFVDEYKAADPPNVAPVDRVDRANAQGTITDWRATALLDWSWRGFGFSTVVRYIPSYDDVNSGGNLNGRTVDSQTFVDLTGSVGVDDVLNSGSWWVEGLVVRTGVTNLLNDDPPFSEVGGFNGFDPTQADVRKRFVFFSITKAF